MGALEFLFIIIIIINALVATHTLTAAVSTHPARRSITSTCSCLDTHVPFNSTNSTLQNSTYVLYNTVLVYLTTVLIVLYKTVLCTLQQYLCTLQHSTHVLYNTVPMYFTTQYSCTLQHSHVMFGGFSAQLWVHSP